MTLRGKRSLVRFLSSYLDDRIYSPKLGARVSRLGSSYIQEIQPRIGSGWLHWFNSRAWVLGLLLTVATLAL